MVLVKEKQKTFNLMLIAYSFFAFLSHLLPSFSIILLALLIGSVFIFDDSDILCFISFTSCFMACLDSVSRFLKMLDLCMAIIVIKKLILSIKNKNKKNILFISALFIFGLIVFIYSLFISNFHIYKLFQGLGILLTITTLCLIDKINVKKLTLTLSIGLIISSILSIISYTCGIMSTQPFLKDGLCGIRFSAYFNYVNSLAFYCSLCQTAILTLFLTKSLNIKKWFWLILVITFIGLCTFSKSFILITLLTYTIFIMIGFIKSKNKKNFIKLSIVGFISICALALIFNKYLFSIVTRFYTENNYGGGLNTITTGRLDIWKWYFKHITSSILYILFGCGITVNSLNGFTPHCFYLSLLYRFGVVGVLVIIYILIFIFKQNKTNKDICWYFPLSIILVNAFVEDISSSLFTCLPLLIALCFVLKNNNDYSK